MSNIDRFWLILLYQFQTTETGKRPKSLPKFVMFVSVNPYPTSAESRRQQFSSLSLSLSLSLFLSFFFRLLLRSVIVLIIVIHPLLREEVSPALPSLSPFSLSLSLSLSEAAAIVKPERKAEREGGISMVERAS
jgi:hypothetical protein